MGVITGQDEPGLLGVSLHDSPECGLGIWGQVVGLIQEDHVEWNLGFPTLDFVGADDPSAGELLDLGSDDGDASLIAGIQLHEVRLPRVTEHGLHQGDGGAGFPSPRGTCKHQVWEGGITMAMHVVYDVSETTGDVVLTDYLVEMLGAV